MKYGHGRFSRVRVHQRNRSVQRNRGRCEVFEDITVVEAVGIGECGVITFGSGKSKPGGMLGDAVDCAVVGEVDVEGKGFGAYEIR